MRIPTPLSPPDHTRGLALLDCEKAETLADSLEALFQPENDPLVTAVIEMVNEEMRTYSLDPATETKLTNPREVQDALRGFNFGKAPGPNGVPDRVLNHLPPSAVSILLLLFNVIFRIQYFTSASNKIRVFSIQKPGKDLALPSSYRLKCLQNMTGKLFERISLIKILREVRGRGIITLVTGKFTMIWDSPTLTIMSDL